jgi:hypothetical protein
MWTSEYPCILYSLDTNRPNQSLGTYPNITLASHVFPSHVEHSHFGAGVVEDFIEPHCSFFGACNNLSREHLSYGNWKVVKNEAINKTSM